MTKSELIEKLSLKQSQLTSKDVEFAVPRLTEQMAQTLASGGRIEIRGFGSFCLHYRPPRIGRNPKTGEAVALAGLVFAVLNAQPVLLNYYFGSRDIPLAFIVAVAIAFGALLGVSASLGMVVKAKRQTSGLRRTADAAERELAHLRTLSLNDKS